MNYWLWFATLKGVGSVKKQALLEKFDKLPEKIFKATKQELMQVNGIGPKLAEEILNDKDEEVVENGPSKTLLKEIQLLAKALFQNNYKLMETHLAVYNLYSNYSKEEKTVIDEYEDLDKRVNRLITKMNSLQFSIRTKLRENTLLNV